MPANQAVCLILIPKRTSDYNAVEFFLNTHFPAASIEKYAHIENSRKNEATTTNNSGWKKVLMSDDNELHVTV